MMEGLLQETYNLLGIVLTSRQIAALERYQEELTNWNDRYNLTAIHDPEKVSIKHFLDSMTCSLVMRGSRMERVIDIGTGAGFPGLPLKILYPNIQLTLVDSVGKKAAFCEHISRTLNLDGVKVLKARAEDIGHLPEHREQYDWAVGRAVAVLPVLAEYLLPLVSVGGRMLALKGETAPAEAHTTEHAARLLGGRLRQLLPVTLPGVAEQRYLVVVDKIAATLPPYPRRAGIPSKKPLTK
jgi:16S rRNA (guanine527-N7)-methyltransferase